MINIIALLSDKVDKLLLHRLAWLLDAKKNAEEMQAHLLCIHKSIASYIVNDDRK